MGGEKDEGREDRPSGWGMGIRDGDGENGRASARRLNTKNEERGVCPVLLGGVEGEGEGGFS